MDLWACKSQRWYIYMICWYNILYYTCVACAHLLVLKGYAAIVRTKKNMVNLVKKPKLCQPQHTLSGNNRLRMLFCIRNSIKQQPSNFYKTQFELLISNSRERKKDNPYLPSRFCYPLSWNTKMVGNFAVNYLSRSIQHPTWWRMHPRARSNMFLERS
jgi:hypothetical protein